MQYTSNSSVLVIYVVKGVGFVVRIPYFVISVHVLPEKADYC
jgi:hypothetical protein